MDVRPDPIERAEGARQETRALGWAAVAAFATIVWLMQPIGVGILFGGLMAFTFQPLYERMLLRWHPGVAALTMVIGSTVAVAGSIAALGWILVRDGTMFARELVASLGPGGYGGRVTATLGTLTTRVGIPTATVHAKIQAILEDAAGHVFDLSATLASATASAALAIFFAMLTMYFILRQGRLVAGAAEDALPLRPEHTRKLFEEIRRLGRTTLSSTVLTAAIQGVLATFGYWIGGLPRPLFFGVLTAATSLVPGIGTTLVWVPAGVSLLLLGRTGSGVFVLAWGVFVVTAIPTYVIQPRLVGRGSNIPALWTFIALFGGAALLGLKGLVIGPVLMGVSIATLRLYTAEARSRRKHGS